MPYLVIILLLMVAKEARVVLHVTRILSDRSLIMTLLVVVSMVVTARPRLCGGWVQVGPLWLLLVPLMWADLLHIEIPKELSLN